MAGHRKGTGRPKQAAARHHHWRTRIGSASSSEQFFDVASDWYRAVCTHVPDAHRRTELLNAAGQYLAGQADQLARELTP